MITLIDKELYNRKAPEIRNILEERAMRYTAVCTSMLADRVSPPGDTWFASDSGKLFTGGGFGRTGGRREYQDEECGGGDGQALEGGQ